MSWLYLCIAVVFEICGTTLLKLSNGLTNIKHSILLLIFYGLSICMLSLALKRIDISVAYAIWSGFGIAIIAGIGIVYFKEPFSVQKCIFIGFILFGVVGLNLIGVRR